jgi:hypothetical protein
MSNQGYGMDYDGGNEFASLYVEGGNEFASLSPVRHEKENESEKSKDKEVVKEEKLFESIHSPGTKKKLDSYNRKKKLDAYTSEKQKKEAKKAKIEALVAKKKDIPKVCNYCHMIPCCMDEHYEDMMEVGLQMEGHGNREIRHAMYRYMARALWGSIGKGVRRELPKCVIGEVHDAYPKKKDEAYVGFKPYGSHKPVFMMEDSNDSE